ncbi:hypothetical protein Tco_0903359 [Tanacetum coccineum]
MNSTTLNGESINLGIQRSESCDKCFDLDAELLKSQNAYNDISKSYSQLDKLCISLELTKQLNQEIFQKESFSNNQNGLEIPEYFENNDLKAQLQAKDITICIEPLSHRLKNNKDAHEDYLKKTIENTDTIHGLVERARKQNPSKPLLDSACKFTKHVQKLLVYVCQTCPSFTKPSEKLVAVTSMNKVKKVRFLERLTSSSNIHKQVESSKTPDSNTPVLPST